MSLFRDAFYLGLGAMSITRERAEKFYDEMMEKGEISKDEAKKFIDEAMKRGEEERKEIQAFMRREMDEMRKDMVIVRRSEFEALEARVKALEEKLQEPQD